MGLTKKDSLALKGIGILTMIFHHLYCSVSRFENYTINFSPFTQEQVVNLSLYFKLCVSIFAFITGFGLVKSISKTELNRKSVASWNINRLIKTMSGFWIIYIIAFITTMIIDRYPLEIYFKGSALKGLLFMLIDFLGLANLFGTSTLCGTWWYMSAAIIFILAVPLIYLLSKKIGYLPILVLIIALPRLMNVGYPGTINTYTFMPIIVLGMMCSEYNVFENISKVINKNPIYYIAFVIFLLLIILASIRLLYVYKYDKAWDIQLNIIPVFFIMLCRYTVLRIPGLNNILEFIGKHSMTMFLTHTFIRYNYFTDFIYMQKHFMISYILLFVMALILALVIDTFLTLIKYDSLVNKLLTSINKNKGLDGAN